MFLVSKVLAATYTHQSHQRSLLHVSKLYLFNLFTFFFLFLWSHLSLTVVTEIRALCCTSMLEMLICCFVSRQCEHTITKASLVSKVSCTFQKRYMLKQFQTLIMWRICAFFFFHLFCKLRSKFLTVFVATIRLRERDNTLNVFLTVNCLTTKVPLYSGIFSDLTKRLFEK